jgi:DNA repair exonuclease SbcCD ATPase subunit
LKHIGNELILDNNYKNENNEEIQKIIDISKEYLRLKGKNDEYDVRIKKIDEIIEKQDNIQDIIKYPLLKQQDVKKIEKEMYMLQDLLETYKIQLVDDKLNIENLKKGDKKYKLRELQKEYEEILLTIGNEKLEELIEQKKIIENKIKINNENKYKKEIFEKELSKINEKINDIKNEQFDKISELKKEIEMRKNAKKMGEIRLEKWKIIEKFEEEKKEFEKTRDYLMNLDKVIQNISYLKHISCEIEHLTMTNIIESINCNMNDLLLMIFDQPINVEFSIFKQNRSNSNIKPSISLKILYKGNEIDSLSCLSGGEADRVSLAITLALSKFSSCPFILLDEFASGLDVNTKEMVIKSIKSMNDNKMIICISHDTVEGIYDYVEKI